MYFASTILVSLEKIDFFSINWSNYYVLLPLVYTSYIYYKTYLFSSDILIWQKYSHSTKYQICICMIWILSTLNDFFYFYVFHYLGYFWTISEEFLCAFKWPDTGETVKGKIIKKLFLFFFILSNWFPWNFKFWLAYFYSVKIFFLIKNKLVYALFRRLLYLTTW